MLNIHQISCDCVMIVMPGCARWSHVAPLMPGTGAERKILLDCETGPRDRGETCVPMTPGQPRTTHLTHNHRALMASLCDGRASCEDFMMAEDINDERGEAVSVTGCGQRRQAAGLHQSQAGSGWLGLTHGPIRG